MNKNKKIISSLISSVLLLTSSTGSYLNASLCEEKDECISSKISEELLEIMDYCDDSEFIPIEIIIKDLDWSIVDNMIEDNSNFKVSDYSDIDAYRNGIMQNIIKETENEFGFEIAHITPLKNSDTNEISFTSDIYFSAMTPAGKSVSEMDYDERTAYILSKVSDAEKKKLADDFLGMSPITKRISDDIDDYLKIRRKCVTEAYHQYNYDFIDDYVSDNQIIADAGFAPYLIVKASKSQIENLEENKDVESINYYNEVYDTNLLKNASSITGVTEVQNYNNNGYTGVNIKIGVIEAENHKFNSNASMLSGCSNLYYVQNPSLSNTTAGTHATEVTSIIKGKTVNVNGQTYKGVAPDASVYQISYTSQNNILSAIDKLLEYNVSIINLSAGTDNGSAYSNYDWIIDQAIDAYGITFVIAAGNKGDDTGNVTSPGKAYNAITVGNLDTSTVRSRYSVDSSSSYITTNMTNKPDIVAPGTSIYIPGIGTDTGTSLSAPIVTGIAAQMLQCDPTLKVASSTSNKKTYYNNVKACMLLGANNDVISLVNNSAQSAGSYPSILCNKTGAGLVDAKKTIDILKRNNYYLGNVKLDISSNWTSPSGLARLEYYEAGTRVRAVLCYSKIDQSNNNNLELYILDAHNNIMEYSVSSLNNVEIVEYEVTEDGYYVIDIEKNGPYFYGNPNIPGALAYYEITD